MNLLSVQPPIVTRLQLSASQTGNHSVPDKALGDPNSPSSGNQKPRILTRSNVGQLAAELLCSVMWRCGPNDPNINAFAKLAKSLKPVVDKVTLHKYQTMFGIFHSGLASQRVKFLEIGLGCGQPYGVGASIPLWKVFCRRQKSG